MAILISAFRFSSSFLVQVPILKECETGTSSLALVLHPNFNLFLLIPDLVSSLHLR